MFAVDRWWALLLMLVVYGGLIILLVWFVMWAIRLFPGSRIGGGHSHSALAILDERFARGEIDQQEYEKRKAALKAP
jgi:putative membrane protein